ncbi:phage antirepressor N-terminal domain-containing protein [Vibrio sp. S234-5]|uniref:phage antirepressor N-terminal domain-containing protein n=1 Tax=Vibrio sp. S234-5 TaxID=1616781 RepID=UPI0006989169|nr:phage antirepressor N-terminal domain-containing protein [Vibrio sp. S234-5]
MPNQIKVPFHGSNLFIVDRNGEPYTPMKPIVEGMGLAWQSQHKKLTSNSERWGITMMVIPSVDPHNSVTCIPLRKLFGWLQTLQPNRIREDIRDKVIQYQNECDDVLWKYWTDAQVIQTPEPPLPVPSMTRIMLVIENGQTVEAKHIPNDAFVVSKSRIANLIAEPGIFTMQEMAQISEAVNKQIVDIALTAGKAIAKH